VANCPACNELLTEPPRCRSARWNVVECPHCTHVFRRPEDVCSPTGENAYFEGDNYLQWRNDNLAFLQARARRRIDLALAKTRSAPGKVLEIGCATGDELDDLRRRGWDAYGLDLSQVAIDIARQRYPQVNTQLGTESVFLDADPRPRFDLIMGFHVAEHIPDVRTCIRNLSALCRPGGHLYFCVPHWQSWSRMTMGDDWPSFSAEHIHHYTAKSMRAAMAAGGFEVIYERTAGYAWPWLGGVKRKLLRLTGHRLNTAAKSGKMPGRFGQCVLEAGDVLLQPLFVLEAWFGRGSELRVIAQKT
jgi:SAM-dependent methyltransferase